MFTRIQMKYSQLCSSMSTMWLVLVMCASFAATQYVTRTVEQKLPPGFQPSFVCFINCMAGVKVANVRKNHKCYEGGGRTQYLCLRIAQADSAYFCHCFGGHINFKKDGKIKRLERCIGWCSLRYLRFSRLLLHSRPNSFFLRVGGQLRRVVWGGRGQLVLVSIWQEFFI